MALPEQSCCLSNSSTGSQQKSFGSEVRRGGAVFTAPGTRRSQASRHRGSRRVRCRRLVVHSSDVWLDMSERSTMGAKGVMVVGAYESTVRSPRRDARRKKEAKRLASPNWGDTGRRGLPAGKVPKGLYGGEQRSATRQPGAR
jgi:hypothetical protein